MPSDKIFQLAVAANGRLILPAALRKRLKLSHGGALLAEETSDGVVLRTLAQSIAQAQALSHLYTADKPDASVDAFLAKRRDDSGG